MNSSHDLILDKAKEYAHLAYALAQKLPKHEVFGLGSQLRRAALSVPLNIVEGFARQMPRTQIQFLKVSYASLQESQFILTFARDEQYFTSDESEKIYQVGVEISKLLWVNTHTLQSHQK